MTIRNLDAVLKPRSVAVIGASNRASSIGRMLTENLLGGGFSGPIMPVNPKHETVLGLKAYPDVASLPSVPDLGVIATPAATVPKLIRELADVGARGAVVISAGFSAGSDEGPRLRQAMLDAARPALLRIVGPNGLGLLVPGIGLNASFSHLTPLPGRIAFLAQSGAITTSILDWAHGRGIGFSHLVSLGDMADVDFGDLLDYLASDAGTRSILLYVEAITQARKFMSAARAAARMKPVLVVKGGRHAGSAEAAATHTGVLAGADAAYDAAFRRAGMLRVYALEDLFDAVETLALARPPRGGRLAIVTNGGGIGVLAADALLDHGGELAALSEETLGRLDSLLPSTWSHRNPVDIIGDATADRYAAVLPVVLEDPGIDGVLVLHCPTAVASGVDAARAVIAAVGDGTRCTVVTSWVGEHAARASREVLQQHRVPTFATPEHAVRAFMQMVDYRRNQQLLMETPPSLPSLFAPDLAAAGAPIAQALAEQREWLSAPQAKQVLSAYGVAVTRAVEAATPDEAAAAAQRIGGAVALKILAPAITHKSDVGGVALGLTGAEAVRDAATTMLAQVRRVRPDARISGISVEPMAERPKGLELIIGAATSGEFGPVMLFGEGGTAVEVTADTAVGLPPLNLHLAKELMTRTRVYRRMLGYRDVPAVDVDAVALTLTRVSQLLIDFPRIEEIDINPLLADANGVLAVDARIKVRTSAEAAASSFVICPYPKELEQDVPLADGRTLLLRPILPEDEPALHAGFARLSPEEVRARFFVPIRALSHVTAARFTQIDYDREMALVLTGRGVPGKAEIYGVVHLSADPDNRAAEFAVIVQKSFTGMGLGLLLMRRIIEYARTRGIGEVFGDVLVDNRRMRGLCKALGFAESSTRGDLGIVRVTLRL